MVRILATADWQLDMKAHRLSKDAKDELYKARLDALSTLLKLAKKENVDYILAAGDLFEVANPREQLVKDTAKILQSHSNVPIHVIPGNHDLYGDGGVWKKPAVTSIKHLIIHSEYSPIELDGFVLHPLPVKSKHELTPYNDYLEDVNADERIHVVMAHAHDTSYMDIEKISSHEIETKLKIDTSIVQTKGYDFCILGHWHSWTEVQKNALYPGTHEQTKFGERDAGYVAIIDIENGKEPIIAKHKVGQLSWEKMEIDVTGNSEDEIINVIREKMDQEVTFLSVDLVGECDVKFTADSIPRIIESCDPMFKHFELYSEKTEISFDIDSMMKLYPLTPLLNDIQNELLSELSKNPDDADIMAELVEFWRHLRDSGLIGGGV